MNSGATFSFTCRLQTVTQLPEMASPAATPADTDPRAPFSAEQLTWLRATFGPDCIGAAGRASSAPGGSLLVTDPLPGTSTGEQRRGGGSGLAKQVRIVNSEQLLAVSESTPRAASSGSISSVCPTFRFAGWNPGSVSPSAVAAMPLFSVSASPSHGLELLASAAAADGSPMAPKPIGAPSRSGYNPAGALPTKLAKCILELEFVDTAEIGSASDIQQIARPAAARPTATDISLWVEKFPIMAGILSTRFPEKAAEFFAYQATIVHAERCYEGHWWAVYDLQFRREALARKDLN